MVKLMLEGLQKNRGTDFEIHHIDARFSDSMEDIGRGGFGKVLRAIRFSAAAIRRGLKFGIKDFYYVPAPPKQGAMIRDWIVMAMCRPFFPRVILHWHAVGLGEWTLKAQKNDSLKMRAAAWMNRRMLGGHYRSLVLTEWGRADAEPFSPRSVIVVPNGIADPCPDFAVELLGKRISRRAGFVEAMSGRGAEMTYVVCYLGHCCAEKGLWDAMRAVAMANDALRAKDSLLRIVLKVAGEFPSEEDRVRFSQLSAELSSAHSLPEDGIVHIGYVNGLEKKRFLSGSDCLCFPTRYRAESFGLVAAEALAFGIPPVTSDWRMLPDLMGAIGLPVARAGDPKSIAEGILDSIGRDDPESLRNQFSVNFHESNHLRILADALLPDQAGSAKTEP